MRIGDAVYSMNDRYLGQQNKTTRAGDNSSTNVEKNSEGAKNQAGADAYQISLSPQVEYAKTREELGLPALGKLRLEDFKTAMGRDEAMVTASLQSILADLGMDPHLKVNLSLDEDGEIVTSGSFTGQKALETALNSDPTLVESFQRLTANHHVMQFIASSATPSAELNLLAALEADDSQDTLTQIARQYDAFRSTANPLETLIQFSGNADPYVYSSDPDSA